MREGLIPHAVTTVLKLQTSAADARALTELLGEVFDPAETGVAAFEDQATGEWRLDVYFGSPPDEAAVRELVASVAGESAAREGRFETVAAKDWVAASLDGLRPVEAGRFLVHGAHDRARVAGRVNRIRIEIEAALAFGTGHHGTTFGCLRALDRVLRAKRPTRPLDIGTGTGLLAIAAARALKRPIVASDIDAVAVAVARENIRANAAGAYVRLAVAPGLRHPIIAAGGPYDLIFANILAGPLKQMAPSLSRALTPRGEAVLSGLLAEDVRGVVARYRACGLALVSVDEADGWRIVRMRRGGAGFRPRRRVQRSKVLA